MHLKENNRLCIYCNEKTARVKQDNDWKSREKTVLGYNPEMFNYYYCPKCKKTQMNHNKL